MPKKCHTALYINFDRLEQWLRLHSLYPLNLSLYLGFYVRFCLFLVTFTQVATNNAIAIDFNSILS